MENGNVGFGTVNEARKETVGREEVDSEAKSIKNHGDVDPMAMFFPSPAKMPEFLTMLPS